MYTITTGGSSSDSRQDSRSRVPSRGRSYSSPREGGYSRGGSSRGGYASRGGYSSRGASPRPFNAKRSFKKDYIDEKLFINKEAGVAETDNYTPKHKFTDFNIAELLSANLTAKGLINPSPIQTEEALGVQCRILSAFNSAADQEQGAFVRPHV
jgi:hypothetical protein